jgi:L-aminopeptidase/D-esterase-like protein
MNGNFSGTGNITTSGWVYFEGSSTATGSYTINTGRARLASGMGGASRSLTVNDGAGVIIGACSTSDFTFASPITLNGAGPAQTG